MSLRTIFGILLSALGSQIAEFAVAVPLLVVFCVGIFDFSGAYNLKQKISSAAQAGASLAANQATRDLDQASPPSVTAVRDSIFNYLANNKVLANANVGTCKSASAAVAHAANSLVWQYTIHGCGNVAGDDLVITIDRGNVFASGSENIVASDINITYPHHWTFNRVIQLVAPGSFAATTLISANSVAQSMT